MGFRCPLCHEDFGNKQDAMLKHSEKCVGGVAKTMIDTTVGICEEPKKESIFDAIPQCEVCGKEMPEWKPQYCCSAFDCTCQGRPVHPPICSEECWDELTNLDKKENKDV